MNKIKNLSKKSKIIVISIVAFVLLLIGGTFAWLEWSSEINALVNGRVCAPEIVFLGGNTINGNGLRPISNKENGLKKDISVNLENLCENDTATMDLYLDLEIFPTELAEESLVWELYKVTTENETEVLTLLNNGNFDGKTEGDTIELTDDTEIVTSNISNYRLYIYIDGSFDNPNTMQNKSFKLNLYGEGRDAIYKEYVMKNLGMTQSTTYFINSSISKDTIESVDIVSFSNLPEGVIYVEDVSSNSDESIKLYYLENPETNLKKVYLASSSGLIKMNTSMDYMFAGLTHVESLDLSRLDTSNVTSMVGVFYNSKMTLLNVSTWDTSKVMNMNYMFRGASGLTNIDLDGFVTTNLKSMSAMFADCTSLKMLDLSSFDTTNVTVLSGGWNNGTFWNCTSLESLNISSFNTSNVTSMNSMFYNCKKLQELDLSSFNTSNVTSMSYMFENCSSLKVLDLSNFDNSKVTALNEMFDGCTSLEYLDISNFSNAKLKSFCSLGLPKLKEIKLTNFKTSTFTSMHALFSGAMSLKKLDLSSFDTSNVTSMWQMFQNCYSLEEIDLSSFNTSNVNRIDTMFSGCTKLKELDLSNFDLSNITSLNYTFEGCSSLPKLDLSSLDFSKITSYVSTFSEVKSATEIIVKDCTQYNKFVELFGNSYTNLHTVNNDNCTV